MQEDARLLGALRRSVRKLDGSARDYDTLLERIGDARFVMLGESTHGTHEFYRERAKLTKRLIRELGFHAVAIEGDFPDAYRVNLHVRGKSSDATAEAALSGFQRFPSWMWRNADVLDFVGFMADINRTRDEAVGFYGLDLYSLYGSIQAIVTNLEHLDPEAAQRARQRYACFDHFQNDAERYAQLAGSELAKSCEDEVTGQLLDLLEQRRSWLTRDDHGLADQAFYVEQNARVVKNAESYYRNMYAGRALTWNLRDEHMLESLEALAQHLDRRVGRSKIVVWAHNSHLGDARYTALAALGEKNLGQLARERFAGDAFLVGFTTFDGSVTAASEWGGPVERKTVRPALPRSYESLFHQLRLPRFLLDLRGTKLDVPLPTSRIARAIGVIYRPETERASHYFRADLGKQFDAVVHIDHTRAVEPLERTPRWTAGEAPETYPFAV